MYVDLQSIDSIKTFVNIVLHDYPKIHVVILNAGISMPVRDKNITDDGFEVHFQVNYLGHFILTKLLVERLKDSSPSRLVFSVWRSQFGGLVISSCYYSEFSFFSPSIVVVSSSLHESGEIDFENLNGEKGWKAKGHKNPAYCNTKLMDTYFAYELVRRLQDTKISVYALCPGFCKTGLMRYVSLKWYHWPLLIVVALFYMRSARQVNQYTSELEGRIQKMVKSIVLK